MSKYPDSIWLSRTPDNNEPDDDTAWLDVQELPTDVNYIRADIADTAFQQQLSRVRQLSEERRAAISRIASLQTEKEMLAEALKASYRNRRIGWNLPMFRIRRMLRECGNAI